MQAELNRSPPPANGGKALGFSYFLPERNIYINGTVAVTLRTGACFWNGPGGTIYPLQVWETISNLRISGKPGAVVLNSPATLHVESVAHNTCHIMDRQVTFVASALGAAGTYRVDYDVNPWTVYWSHGLVGNDVGSGMAYVHFSGLANPPIGNPDLANCSTGLNGWAFDPDRSSQSVRIHVYGDYPSGDPRATFIGVFTANTSRPDVNSAYGISGSHGFSVLPSSIPNSFKNGTRGFYIYGIGINSSGVEDGNNSYIGYETANFLNCGPEGWHGSTTCTNIKGWTLDRDRLSQSLDLHIYADGLAGGGGTNIGTFKADKDDSAYNLGGVIGVDGGNHAYDIVIPSPWNVGSHRFYVYSIGVDGSGANDGVNTLLSGAPSTLLTSGCVPTGTSFTITPVAQVPSADNESPSNITFGSYVTVAGTNIPAVGVQATVSRRIVYKRGVATTALGSAIADDSRKYRSGQDPTPARTDTTSSSPAGGWQAGDQYCMQVTVNPGSGQVDVSGNVTSPGAAVTSEGCDTVKNKPYVSFYGNSVRAGTGFGSSCSPGSGDILTYYRDGVGGSGVQFAAVALGKIEQFSSASLRTASPARKTGLMFANVSASYGNFGSTGCMPDYFSARSTTPTTTTVISIGNPAVLERNLYTPNSYRLLTITGSTQFGLPVNGATRRVVYVDGNAYITSDIKFANSSSWASSADIPSLYIIAKGDIYIDKSVKQLDGVFIAQPGGSVGDGKIYTCATINNPLFAGHPGLYYAISVPDSSKYTDCANQLVVNGAFVAKQIKLQRTFSSLRYSNANETPTSPGRSCATAPVSVSAPVCAAEQFNFSPEMYLVDPQLQPSSGQSRGTYDYATGMPPVL